MAARADSKPLESRVKSWVTGRPKEQRLGRKAGLRGITTTTFDEQG
jgi:hypothetical protein